MEDWVSSLLENTLYNGKELTQGERIRYTSVQGR